ncbi:hypothetical protein CEXT_327581 [Caerostris extrusa]|uniref:Uncharacterized protein n=1 Tax=Caerostris extrusa TaxID=172846 RepID=A0AAV4NMJ9_CAEEX|nr:hypothetical protein CEXT_327581 [Caerostris extrusa]
MDGWDMNGLRQLWLGMNGSSRNGWGMMARAGMAMEEVTVPRQSHSCPSHPDRAIHVPAILTSHYCP